MAESTLILWVFVYPSSILVGLLGAAVAYVFAGPREPGTCPELAREAWRIYALAATVPAFIVAAELYLWGFRFEAPPPFLLTGILAGLGLAVGAAVPGRVVHAFCNEATARRGRLLGAALATLVALLLVVLSPIARASAWTSLTGGATEPAAATVAAAKAYGYATITETTAALDVLLHDPASTLSFAHLALEAPGEPGTVQAAEGDSATSDSSPRVLLDRELESYLADRLAGLAAEQELGSEVVPVIWELLQGHPDDEARTLQAYASTVNAVDLPEGGVLAPAGTVLPPRDAALLVHGLESDQSGVPAAFLAILGRRARQGPFGAEVVTAVAAQLESEPPLDQMATTVLLREGSRAALRAVMPAFTDLDSPVWDLLQANCPRGTQELRALSRDDDREVARGAWLVLDYVRQFCVTSRPIGG